VAFTNGWINSEQLEAAIQKLGKSSYALYLSELLKQAN